MARDHVHRCPRGCDECNDQDCARRRVGVIPACDCDCHVRCFQVADRATAAVLLGALRRLREGGGTFIEARAGAGLSVGQTARLTGLERARVEALEAGAAAEPDERAKLGLLYKVVGFDAACVEGPARAVTQCPGCHRVWSAGEPPHHERFCVQVTSRGALN